MRSGELARLAGVTVRALRHYHQVGVLDEPPRGGNGYRGYDVHHLVRVLRIRRLAALGVPLERMPALLDDPGPAADDGTGAAGGAAALLDELDAELASQIDRLTRQRELVAELRRHGAPPDLPPELAPFATVFAATALPPDLARFDRDQAVLLAHLGGEAGAAHLARLYERMSDPAIVAALTSFAERFARIGPAAADDEVTELVDDVVAAVGPVVREFAAAEPPIDLGRSVGLVDAHTADTLNERQREVLARLGAGLDA